MPKEFIDHIADPDSKYDRFVAATFKIVFQLAEIMLVVGAFKYASVKTNSTLLSSISFVLSLVGAMWLGLILPGTIGRLEFWKKVNPVIRRTFALVMIVVSCVLALLYMQSIAAIANSSVN